MKKQIEKIKEFGVRNSEFKNANIPDNCNYSTVCFLLPAVCGLRSLRINLLLRTPLLRAKM